MGSDTAAGTAAEQVDVVVVGAGFSGLYLLHRLRALGFSAVCFEAADDVGGTWWWNRYPGARCDIPTTDYTYSFDADLEAAWTWSEKYATQPEILEYLRFVADRFDLRRDITFGTRVEAAAWDETSNRWRVRTDAAGAVSARFLVMATGCLSVPKVPDLAGVERFEGQAVSTGLWPHDGVDLAGKRVAVIGTGSSGIQSIPLIAQQAAELTVLQRTPNFSVPAFNGPQPAGRVARLAADRDAYRDEGRHSPGGVPREVNLVNGKTAPAALVRERFDAAWAEGELFSILGVLNDQGSDARSNELVASMIRERIRAVVDDPAVADLLTPTDHPFGSKRPCLDTSYYATYNQPHVRLVDLRSNPITTVDETGIQLADGRVDVDVIVYATGFDAMTGALFAVDIQGREGLRLKDFWADGPTTYLGLSTVGFPNLFTITGPGSPSVLSNMAVSIEQHVDWVTACLADLRVDGFEVIEPTPVAQAGWDAHCADCADITLHPTAKSWYMGANVPGKPRVLYPYIGGVDRYRKACDEVAARDYLGFVRTAADGSTRCTDGVVNTMQPDVAIVLDMVAELGLPPLESMPAESARAVNAAMSAERPPGPDVAEVVDGTLPGAAGPLTYRLYRSGGSGPLVAYFHGGGWVLGDHASDDPFCRDLCSRLDATVVSVGYRHAPEDPFPAAADDAWAATRWIADNAGLIGSSGPLVVAGWSAGGNLAAVVAQRARDEGLPIAAQLLVCPVTDSDLTRASYVENAEGKLLTTALMAWFWDQYAPADRHDPRAAPLHGDLRGVAPAVVVTADFDPLRDEGVAYAESLAAQGVPVTRIRARGHSHTSLHMVDVVVSGGPVRAEIAGAVRAALVREAAPA